MAQRALRAVPLLAAIIASVGLAACSGGSSSPTAVKQQPVAGTQSRTSAPPPLTLPPIVKVTEPAETSAPATSSPAPAPSPSPVQEGTASPDPNGACPAANGIVLHTAPGAGRTVALTFDDGPSPWTPAVLDVLRSEHVHATFFVVGSQAAKYPEFVRRAAAEGHLIGNHTWDHRYPRMLAHGWTRQYLRNQIGRTSTEIGQLTGQPICWFRPPGGFMPPSVIPVARSVRMTVVLWSVDPKDWDVQGTFDRPRPTPTNGNTTWTSLIAARVSAGVTQPHPIVLMHDGGGYRGATVAALTTIIHNYRAHGFTFVTLDGRS